MKHRFKNRILLSISRGRSFIDIYHEGRCIGSIMVSEQNRNNQISIDLRSDLPDTRFKIAKTEESQISEDTWNQECFNK